MNVRAATFITIKIYVNTVFEAAKTFKTFKSNVRTLKLRNIPRQSATIKDIIFGNRKGDFDQTYQKSSHV